MTAASFYRKLHRQLIRVPLDQWSLRRLQEIVRREFKNSQHNYSYSVENRARYDHLLSLCTDLVENNKYKEFGKLLDIIYKVPYSQPWMNTFCQTLYLKFRQNWPQVHLIREFGSTSDIKRYNEELERSSPVEDFSISRALGVACEPGYAPVSISSGRRSRSAKIEELVAQVHKFHGFLYKNASTLLDVKISPLEVIYEPNKYGLPLSVADRERKLRVLVNTIKRLIHKHQPIGNSSLSHLIAVARGRDLTSSTQINPRFFAAKTVQKSKEDVLPYTRKYLQQKALIPNARNIRFLYREFVVRQFIVENNEYRLTPMLNFYD